jgi:carbamoyl-phosphate synthase small subunit
MGLPTDDQRYFGPAVLVLADGRVFRGRGFGARSTKVGEVVFNTSMTGYQEILSDPSYAGQLVCLTAAEIGNTGTNAEDQESDGHGAEGLIIRSLARRVSSWRSEASLGTYLERLGLPGIAEIDTRALTRHLRTEGAMMGALSTESDDVDRLLSMAREAPSMEGRDLVSEVTTAERYEWDEPTWERTRSGEPVPAATLHVVAYDFGIKRNILRMLRDEGIRTTVVPASTPVSEVLGLKPDGVFLSNGPGDPAAVQAVVDQLKTLVASDQAAEVPVFGICLGHQLLCLALGGSTYKLKFGHHGGNHPVRSEDTGRVAITAQNHGFAADPDSLQGAAVVTEINLFDRTVAGLAHGERPIRSVQYHPEASPGPHDSAGFFRDFARSLRRGASA